MDDRPEGNVAVDEELAQLAHDLRAPLAAMLMWVRLLRSGTVKDVPAALDAIEKSAREMSLAIDCLSNVSAKASPGANTPESDTDVANALTSTGGTESQPVSEHEPVAPARGLSSKRKGPAARQRGGTGGG